VDGVVAAQGMLRGQGAGVAGRGFVDRDGAQLGGEILDRGDRADVRRLLMRPVDELARDQDVGAIPELDGELGAGFVEDQLDKRRRTQ
jgi:hypothetical protein